MTVAALKAALPAAPVVWLTALIDGAPKWGIVGKERLASFAGQLAYESAQFTRLEENLSYSADRLMDVWPKRFPTLELATQFARSPEKLANFIYANRLGNGPPESGDGWWFRGRGPIQLTGFDNYNFYGEKIGVNLVATPEKLLIPAIGIAASGCYWAGHGLNELADRGVQAEITEAINGGLIGLKERAALIDKIRKELG